MKRLFAVMIGVLSLSSDLLYGSIINGERSIVIVVASYKNANWYKQNLNSLFSQKYSNYKILYTDDCSPDGTGELVEKYLKSLPQEKQKHCILIRNTQRIGALANQYNMIHNYASADDIVAIVDGDDWLAHDQVLSFLNRVYADSSVWMTYGQYQVYPSGGFGFNAPIPDDVIVNNKFRYHYNAFSHLRTYYAALFNRIKLEDLKIDGKFLAMTGDLATMIPMIEMAGRNFKFIPNVLYIYNEANVINDHKVSKNLQHDLDIWVRNRPTYRALKTLF